MSNDNDLKEIIYNDYIADLESEKTPTVIERLPLLMDNDLAGCVSGSDYMYSISAGMYRVACKFIQKYNKKLKKFRRKLNDYEFGGNEGTFGHCNQKLIDLTRYALEKGTYYAQVKDSLYLVLDIKVGGDPDNEDADDTYKYTLCFVGKRWKKLKDKFLDMYDEYKEIAKNEGEQYVIYLDERSPSKDIFKPFNQLIFKDKEKVLEYIDNWYKNIPTYYNEYKMIAKLSILLYGEPGTGKSTFAKSVADHFKIDSVTSVPPSYFADSSNENRKRMPRGRETVISIDDIDCVANSREKDSSKENIKSVAKLLSFLDNPPTFYMKARDNKRYPVSMVIASTNYYDKLDSAVKRYGRFDLKIEMVNFTKNEAQQMCDIYHLDLKDVVDEDINSKDFKISPSYLQAKCLEKVDKNLKSI